MVEREVGERMVGEDTLLLAFQLVVLHDTTVDTLGQSMTSEGWVIVDSAGFHFFTFTLHFLMRTLTSGILFSFPTNFPNSFSGPHISPELSASLMVDSSELLLTTVTSTSFLFLRPWTSFLFSRPWRDWALVVRELGREGGR